MPGMTAGSRQLTLAVTHGEDPHDGYRAAGARSASPDCNPIADAVGLPHAPRLLASTPGGAGMSFFELDCFRRNVGFTKPVRENAFLIALQLRTCPDFDLYCDGRLIRPRQFEAGAVAIGDLRTTLATDLRDPFHAIDLYLPTRALDMISDDLGLARVDELRHSPGTAVRDATIRELLLSMRPALAAPAEQTSTLFVDHVAHAIATHVAHRHGGLLLRPVPNRGGLAPSQARRVKELLNANLFRPHLPDRLGDSLRPVGAAVHTRFSSNDGNGATSMAPSAKNREGAGPAVAFHPIPGEGGGGLRIRGSEPLHARIHTRCRRHPRSVAPHPSHVRASRRAHVHSTGEAASAASTCWS